MQGIKQSIKQSIKQEITDVCPICRKEMMIEQWTVNDLDANILRCSDLNCFGKIEIPKDKKDK